MLGNTLKLIRTANENMSINYVASKMELSPRYIKRVEAGITKISLSTLMRFSDFYQMPISQILVFNTLKESLKVTDVELKEYIKRYYACGIDEEKASQKIK